MEQALDVGARPTIMLELECDQSNSCPCGCTTAAFDKRNSDFMIIPCSIYALVAAEAGKISAPIV
jgi:hypothetical protein